MMAGKHPDSTSHTDYYAFGQSQPGRTWVGGDEYRYSHNGHEREDELFEGAQSAEYWMYDSRIGRRWDIDPVVKEWESPYAAFGNNPIQYSDLLGLDAESSTDDGGDGDKGDPDLKKTILVKPPKEKVEPEKINPVPTPKSIPMPETPAPEVKTNPHDIKPPAQDNTARYDDNINRPITNSGQGYEASWYGLARLIDDYFKNRQDNMSEYSDPIRTTFHGFQPTTSGGPTKNVGFSSPFAIPVNNESYWSWLPGGSLGGRDFGNSKTRTFMDYFNGSMGSGGNVGDVFKKDEPKNKPAISVPKSDTIIKRAWHKTNGKVDTLVRSYDKAEYNEKGDGAKIKTSFFK